MRRREAIRHATVSLAVALLWAGGLAPATARALDERPVRGTPGTPGARPWPSLPAADAAGGTETGSALGDRLRERLRGIPLRPVRIGTTPRLPDDPEPGMGLVVRIPF